MQPAKQMPKVIEIVVLVKHMKKINQCLCIASPIHTTNG